MNLIPVSPERHRKQSLLPLSSFDFAKDMAVIPLYGVELAIAALEMPIAFIVEAGEALMPAALVSTEPGRNFFVNRENRWFSSYVPAVLRRHPFVLAKNPQTDELLVCVDEDSGRLSETEGQPLFQEDGQPSVILNEIINFLRTLEENRAKTAAACAVMMQTGIIVPWELKVRKEEETTQLAGLFRVDEARLNSLPGERLLELQAAGALPLIYAHLISLGKLPVLGQLAAAHAKADQAAIQAQTAPTLDSLFGMAQGETIKFNF